MTDASEINKLAWLQRLEVRVGALEQRLTRWTNKNELRREIIQKHYAPESNALSPEYLAFCRGVDATLLATEKYF